MLVILNCGCDKLQPKMRFTHTFLYITHRWQVGEPIFLLRDVMRQRRNARFVLLTLVCEWNFKIHFRLWERIEGRTKLHYGETLTRIFTEMCWDRMEMKRLWAIHDKKAMNFRSDSKNTFERQKASCGWKLMNFIWI